MKTDNSHSKSVRQDQVKILFKQIPVMLLINIPLVLALVWMYWPWVNHTAISIWAVCMFVVMFLRFLYIFIFKYIPQQKNKQWQMYIFTFNSGVSGLLWGSAGVLFFVPGQVEYQLIILLVIILKGAGSVSAVTVYLSAFYAYFPASILPISLMFISQGNTNSILVGIMSLGYLISLTIFGRYINKTLLESLALRHQNEDLLNEAQRQRGIALEASTAKTQFLAAASHDLRQPIHALNLYNGLLKDKVKSLSNTEHSDTAFEKNALQQITDIINSSHKTIENLQGLLDSLLDISKLDAGAIEACHHHFNLANMVKRLQNDYQPVVNELNSHKQISLVWPTESMWVYSDENLIEQVLRNLISNALSYTKKGHIEIKLQANNEHITIEVIDTGMGINSDKQQKIFSEFYQINNPATSSRRHGLGLGLSIVKRIMPIIESTINLDSTPGKGSRFYFKVPKGESQYEQAERSDTGSYNVVSTDTSVLVIEDDIDVANAMRLLLENWGYQTDVRDNLSKTMEMLLTTDCKFDVIISDLQLDEDKTGIDAIKAVRNHFNKQLPALIVTGDINPGHLKAVENENIPMLHKPVSPVRLRAFLRHI